MQPRSRAERQREAAAAAAVTEESLQQEWSVQRELHLQNRAVERFRDKEKEVQHMEAAADLMPEGSEERGDLMRQAVHLRVELEREQAKNPELKQLLKAEAEAAAQAANDKSTPATEGPKIPRPAAFGAGKDAGKGAQRGLFGPAGSGNPAGGLFGLPTQAPQRSGLAEPRSPALQQTLKPAAVAEGRSSASPQPVPPTRPQPAQPGRPHPMGPRAAQPQAVQVAVPAVPPVPPVPVPATHAVAQPTSPSGLENLGNQDAERRRKQNEELKRMLEEQIAEKERQRQDARSQRRGEGGDVQNPMAPLQVRSPAVQPVRQDLNPREARLQSRAAERLREKEREVLQAEASARQMPEGSDQRADMLRHALQLRVDFERAQARNPELRQFMAPELHQDVPLGQPSQPAIPRQGHGGEVGQPWPHERAVQQPLQAQLPPGNYPPYVGALPPFVDQTPLPQAYGVDAHLHPQVHPQIYQGPVGPVADAYLGMPPGAMPGMPPGAMPGMAPGPGPGGPAPGVATPTGLNNLGGDGQQEQRRKRQEEMKRALEEQIAEKERQKKEEAENRRQRDRQIEVPIASQMPAGGQMVPQDPGMSPQVPAMANNIEGHRLGHQEDPGAEQRRKKQEEMKRVLAEQIAEKERQKKEEEERRRQEEEADNERICRELQAEDARLEQRRQEEEARQKALQQQNAAAAAQAAAAARREEDDEPPGPLPNKHHGNHSRASRTTRDTQNQGFNNKSDLFGLPPSAPAASPTASPLPWETQVPQPQQSGTSFRSSRHQARDAAAAHGSLHAVVNPSHAAGTGLQGQAPMGDMLQGLMYQQQELYSHQQEALARLQDEAERLRQEKEMAKQDLLDMKAKQLEEKEKDVKKLQRKLQRQMLLQGGTQLAPMDSMLPSVSSTPRPEGSGALVTSGAVEGAAAPAYLGDFYSKYETPKEPQQLRTERVEAESGYPSDDDFRKMRMESNDPFAWPVAPVPWLQAENEQSQDLRDPKEPRIISSIEAPNPASIGASLFEDSWGKPLENTGQVEARLDQTKDSAREVIGSSSKVITSYSQLGKAGDPFGSTKMEGTLVGESKFLQADPQGCTMGATWKDAAEMSGQALPSMKTGMVEQEKSQKTIKHEIESSSLGSTSKLLESLQVKNEDDTTDPLRILEGAVNAIREARHEDGGHSLTSSAFLSARTSGLGLDGDFGAGDSVTRRVDMAAAEIPLEDLLQSQQGWGNVLRHFGAAAEQEAQEKPLRRQDASHHIGEGSEGGYPSLQKLERLDQTELSSFQGADQSGRSDRVQDSLDLLQDLQQLQATSGSATNGTNGTNGCLGQLGTLQRPIVKDDFAALAAATPEDFDAFLARLKGQEAGSSRGRSPQVSMNVKERAKFGSPTLRAAGSMLGHLEPPSGHRPESGSSGTSDLSAPGALRELRNQRKKPKTAEDLLLHGSDLMIPGPAVGGPGTSLHATMPAEKREVMGGLQALRQEKYQGTT